MVMTLGARGAAVVLACLAGVPGFVSAPGGGRGDPAAFQAAIAGTAQAMPRRRGIAPGPVPPPVELVSDETLRRARATSAQRAGGGRSTSIGERSARSLLHALMGMGPPSARAPGQGPGAPTSRDRASSDEPRAAASPEPEPWPGIYQSTSGRLLISVSAASRTDPLGLCHDLALATLDRRFHLQAFLAGRATDRAGSARARAPRSASQAGPRDGIDLDDEDRLVARRALIEGDALVQALEQQLPGGLPTLPGLARAIAAATRRNQLPDDDGDGDALPDDRGAAAPAEIESARGLFAETAGLMFVATVRARESWQAVDAIWGRPPESSAQILHPELYAREHHPDDVRSRLPLSTLAEWQARAEDTLGELGVRVFLRRTSDGYHAERAAAGWGGDRAVLLQTSPTSGSAFVAWITTWEDETDARDFSEQSAAALADLAGDPGGPGTPAPGSLFSADHPSARQWVARGGSRFGLETAPRTVGLLFAAPEGGLDVLHRLVTAAAAPAAARERSNGERARAAPPRRGRRLPRPAASPLP